MTSLKHESKQPNDSTTKVYFSKNAAARYFSNRRVVCSFRCDEGLWNEAKPVLKRTYGSICRGIEIYLTNFIEATQHGVYFSSTEKPLHIERVVIERNLRPRRKLEVDREAVEGVCFNCGSGSDLVFARFVSGVEHTVCRSCLQNVRHLKLTLKKVLWEVVSGEDES